MNSILVWNFQITNLIISLKMIKDKNVRSKTDKLWETENA